MSTHNLDIRPTTADHLEKSHLEPVHYRLYKRRFLGLFGFVRLRPFFPWFSCFIIGQIVLGIVSGMQWSWFGPIANNTAAEFHLSLTQVNWLGNICSCVFIVACILVPIFCTCYGIQLCAYIGTITLLISAWVRYAGTAQSLSPRGAYTLLILAQFLSAISEPIFQVLGPMYSERWFDLNTRTTATMLIAIATPIGSALGQLVSPLSGTPRHSILVLGIISSAVTPAVFLIAESPPTPPTYSGSKQPQPLSSLCRAWLGLRVPEEAYMTPRERIDFAIVTLIFGILSGMLTALAVLSAQIFQPAGYSEVVSGLLGATSLLSGIIAAVISAPLFDRVFTHHIGLTLKTLVPVKALTWLSMIWAVTPNNTAVLFILMAIIGICSMTMLPIVLELGVELTRNADGSSAILWCSASVFAIMFTLAASALRAGPDANPPYNMRAALIMQGVVVVAVSTLVFLVHAKQARREKDEAMVAGGGDGGSSSTLSQSVGVVEAGDQRSLDVTIRLGKDETCEKKPPVQGVIDTSTVHTGV